MTETDTGMLLEHMERLESLITQSDFGNKWMSTVEVQNYTGLSTKTIHRAVKKGVLKVSQNTGKNLFRKSWVDRWIDK